MSNIINQTNGTILFEEINPEKLDLLTMIGDVKAVNSLSDEKIKEIMGTLCVHSFDEFIEKFDPVVYSFYNANNQKVMYTLKKPDGVPDDMLTEIHLNNQNDFLRMLLTLVDTKRSQGLLNVDFKFEKLTDLISPRKIIEDIKQNRKELRYVYSQYVELDEEDPKKLDIGDKLNVMMEEASTNYNNIMAMLPLAIEDITFYDKEWIQIQEAPYWQYPVDEDVYAAAIDTTFALYRPYHRYVIQEAVRLGGACTFHHLPWYYDYQAMPEDEQYYLDHAGGSSTAAKRYRGEAV